MASTGTSGVDTTATRAPGRARRGVEAVALPALGIGAALAACEMAPRAGLLPRGSFPPTSEIFGALAELVTTTELWTAVGDTLAAWAKAMAVATLIAVPLGLAIGASHLGALLSRLVVDFLRPIPSVALIPILSLIYGVDPALTVVLGVYGAAFPLLFQAMYGIADVDPVARDTARAFGMGRAARLRRIVLPSCAPYLATGMRISASVALILVVTGEYIMGIPGLGAEVLVTFSSGAYDKMYAHIVMAGLLGLAVNLCFHAVERRVLFWHPGHRRDEAAAA
jgi:ABC-type nitrate/sulfonate/bicarbonate transport system permease component